MNKLFKLDTRLNDTMHKKKKSYGPQGLFSKRYQVRLTLQ